MRLAGHELVREGAPYDATTGARVRWHGTGGEGCAKCSCGVMSTPMSSAAARKRWHREHKRVVLAMAGTKGTA